MGFFGGKRRTSPDASSGAVRTTGPLPGPEEPAELLKWYRGLFEAGRYQDIFDHRANIFETGETVSSWEGNQEWIFWLNALPALAGLRLGVPQFPNATFCGYADSEVDRSSRSQVEAVNEIQTRFHGENAMIRPVPD